MNKVSVVIPTYGRAVNLRRAIDSCLDQSYSNIEVIVVDDNDPESSSRYDTHMMINSVYLGNERVKYFCHKANLNGAAARNTGIERSSGNYIAFLDDDDEFLPSKIEEQLRALQQTGCDANYALCRKSKGGLTIYETKYCCEDNEQLIYDIFCQNIEINSSAILCKKEVVIKLKGFDETFKRNQDYEFLIRLLRNYQLSCLNKVLYVMHIDSRLNHPRFINYKEIRVRFMNKFRDDLRRLSILRRINVYRLNQFDLAYYALRCGDIFLGLKYFFKSVPEPTLLLLIWPRIIRVSSQRKVK